MTRTYGETAYVAYHRHAKGLTHDGRPMPLWDNLGSAVQGAWEASAWAVIRQSQEGLSDCQDV